MPHYCRSRHALLQGHRPQPATSRHLFPSCPSHLHCTFCEIWSLATQMATRTPLSQKYACSSSSSRQRSPSPGNSSPIHTETYDFTSSSRLLEAQLQTQRARLSSIMSICIVDGAEESDGLHIALSRCRDAVERLMYQERVLEETIVRSMMERSQRSHAAAAARSRDCGSNSNYYSRERRDSRVHISI